MSRTRILIPAVVILAVSVLAACGGDDDEADTTSQGTEPAPATTGVDPATTSPAPTTTTPVSVPDSGPAGALTADDLNGKTFAITEAEGLDVPPDSALQLQFEDGQLGITGGCNSLSAGYDIVDGKLLLSGGPASTAMACEQPLMDLDTDVAAFIVATPDVSLEGTTLILSSGGTTLTLEEA